ncbi:MAG: tetratricopeptide repeat-containing protein [Tepidisphaeraceae bacterium]|jgi:hypothetical protein
MTSQAPIADRLAPQVAAYQSEGYALATDLAHLQGVRAIGATEATIFYSARILEVLSSAAVQLAGITPSASPFANLETLVQFNLVPPTTLYWANGLRRLGNDVRHILRRPEPADADLAALFAERWIEWFFCHFRLGLKLPAISRDSSPLLAATDPRLASLLRAIDAEDFDPSACLAQSQGEPPYLIAAAIAAVIADLLLNRGETDQAFILLERATARFPQDLRLQQLTVLAWKRRGDLKKAVEAAAPLQARSRDDEETAGIVAGVFKQIYLDGGRDSEWLLKSRRTYLAAWEASKSSSAYLGVNAAATALWLGKSADSRRLAGAVRQLLLGRVAAIAKAADKEMLADSYWDEVTLAEAELLLGDLSAAKARYQAAFARRANFKGNIKVATDQAQRHLLPLGLTISGKDLFNSVVPPPSEPPLVIGVTGHRKLANESALREKISEAMEKLSAGKKSLVILSAIAAGADSLVAEVAMREKQARLHAVLPLEVDDYRRDFSAAELSRFQALLNQSDTITFPAAPEISQRAKSLTGAAAAALDDRQAAYERTGFYVADHCDALIAIWDGQPARGRGGTAEIVDYARKIGRKITWIASQVPYALTVEEPAPSRRDKPV